MTFKLININRMDATLADGVFIVSPVTGTWVGGHSLQGCTSDKLAEIMAEAERRSMPIALDEIAFNIGFIIAQITTTGFRFNGDKTETAWTNPVKYDWPAMTGTK